MLYETCWDLVIANNYLPWAEIVRKGTNKYLYLIQNGQKKMSGYRLKTKDEGRKKVERRGAIGEVRSTFGRLPKQELMFMRDQRAMLPYYFIIFRLSGRTRSCVEDCGVPAVD